MKHAIAVSILFLIGVLLYAQEPIYLFEDFTPATFRLKGNVITKAKFNFDTRGQKVYFMQGTDILEMTNCQNLDTLYCGGRRFVWKNGCLCEFLRKDYGLVYINWKLRDSFVGKVGAMGLTTQGSVEVMQVPGLNSEYSADNIGLYEDRTDVWSVKNENTYFVLAGGKECRIRRPADLFKAYPDRQDDLKQFIRKNNYTMGSAEEAMNIFNYLFTGALPEEKN